MNDEYCGKVLCEFGAPKSEVIDNNYWKYHEKSVNKGHNSNIGSDEFKDVLNNKKVVRHSMKKKTSKNHKIYTQESNKYLYLVLMIRGILKMME